ncbi:MAG: YdcF family protein [Polyangiaceae bacterium]
MFFFLSKFLGWFINPLHSGLLLLAIALVLHRLKKRPRVQRWLVIVAAAEMWLFSLRVVSEPLTWGLEHQYPREPEIAAEPRAIVLLTGMTRIPDRGSYELTEAGDRLVETVRLAHRYPAAKILVSGTFTDDDGSKTSESKTIAGLLADMGVEKERVLLDEKSRNTYENAKESSLLLKDAAADEGAGPILLVTSAMHMPRAAACFRKAGVDVVPWPVDFHSRGLGFPRGLFPGIDDMTESYEALREYFGLLAYKVSGYT